MVEHGIMVVRVVIMQLVPRVPVWIEEARETLIFRQTHVYLTQDQLDAQARMHAKIDQNMHSDDLKKLEHEPTEEAVKSPKRKKGKKSPKKKKGKKGNSKVENTG